MYLKRKLDKEIKNYVKSKQFGPIRWSEIDAIGRRHGFQCYDMEFSPDRDGK